MRVLPSVRFTLVALACAAAALWGAAAASSQDEQPVRLAAHCSTSSDVCYGIFKRRQTVLFDLDLIEPKFARYQLCVDPPRGRTTCHTYRVLTQEQPQYTRHYSEVRWHPAFPARGPGAYAVTWSAQGQRLGPTLRFRG